MTKSGKENKYMNTFTFSVSVYLIFAVDSLPSFNISHFPTLSSKHYNFIERFPGSHTGPHNNNNNNSKKQKGKHFRNKNAISPAPLRDKTMNDPNDDRISAAGAGGILWGAT